MPKKDRQALRLKNMSTGNHLRIGAKIKGPKTLQRRGR